MTKASSSWRYPIRSSQRRKTPALNRRLSELRTVQQGKLITSFGGSGSWLISLSLAIALLYWNWRLFLATGSGIGIMVLVYSLQQQSWQLPAQQLRQFLEGSSRSFVLAVVSGGLATLSTYMAVSIWRDSPSPWLASGAILQGLGTLTVLVLLAWQILERQAYRTDNYFQHLVDDLVQPDPLKRLIAVRQMSQLATTHRLDKSQQRMVQEYFQLLLNQESETVVRDAVLEGLQLLVPPPSAQRVLLSDPGIPLPAVKSAKQKRRLPTPQDHIPYS